MDSGLETALDADAPLVFWALEVLGDGVTLRLLDGPGSLTIAGNAYLGEDPNYGTWSLPAEFADGISTDAPTLSFSLNPPSDSAALSLLAGMAQGSSVQVLFGAVDRSTGAVIGTDVRFEGEIDVATLSIDKNRSGVGLDVNSIWERFFDTDEGLGLTDAAWESIYPGELAFQYVSVVQRQLPWGSDSIRPATVTGVTQNATPGSAAPTVPPILGAISPIYAVFG